MDIPDEIHKKLVCVARRGRFSHIVAPRVWQAPDGRVLQVLDDQSLPLDETFYNALIEFEKAELAKESNNDGEEVRYSQAMNLPSSTSTNEVVIESEAPHSSNNETAAASILRDPKDVIKRISEQTMIAQPRVGKVHSQSILAYMTSNKKAKTSNDHDSFAKLSSKDDKQVNMEKSVSNSDSFVEPVEIHKMEKEESESTRDESRKIESAVFSLRDCLIHQWDARIRARCYVLQPNNPKTSKPAVSSAGTSNVEVIIWFRLGCVRLKNNLAFAQALWLANKKSAKVHAIAFVSEQQPVIENAAYQAALYNLQATLKQEFSIPLTVFDASESVATSLLALWTRMRPVLGIFTAESYSSSSIKVTQATSRAAQCPMFNFDSENSMPLKYLQASAKGVNMESLDAFMSYAGKPGSLPRVEEILKEYKANCNKPEHHVEQEHERIESTSTPSTDSVHSSPGEQQNFKLRSNLPDIVEKRWKVRKLLLNSLSHQWNEKDAMELANGADVNDEQIVRHFRVGTLSPFSIVESRPDLFFTYGLKCYQAFVDDTKNTL